MGIEKRRFIRFSLDIPAFRQKENGEEVEIMIRQISVGGCLAEWDESIFAGDEFRVEITLPNKNRLPLFCKTIYRFNHKEVGVKFQDISQFEQELLASIISDSLESEGLPLLVDPFTQPSRQYEENTSRNLLIEERLKDEERLNKEEMLEEAMAIES